MKTKTITIIILLVMLNLFLHFTIKAQTQLWGTCTGGDTNGAGTIFTVDGNGNNFHLIYSFDSIHGMYPRGKMTLANNGSFYGITWMGGFGNSGVCYQYNSIAGVYTDIHDFNPFPSTGSDAESGMLNASDGNLYGLCSSSGTNGGGVIYKINPITNTYSDIFDFPTNGGGSPFGSLIQATDGNLYGFTFGGGINDQGVIFRFNFTINAYTELYDFSTASGAAPYYGNLYQASDGKLYGVTSEGGMYSNGVIFSYDISTNTYSKLYDFNLNSFGILSYYKSSFIQATDGKLYGTITPEFLVTPFPYKGSIYSFDFNTNTFTDLYHFSGTDGAYPQRALIQGSNSKLLGTTYRGGANNTGVAFSYDIATSTYTKLIDFDSTIGINPDCELTETPVNLGITSLQNNATIKIFPVPAVGYINVIAAQEETIQFTDVLGRDLGTKKITPFSKTQIDVSTFPSVFFVKSKDGVQKVIRN